MPHTDETYLGDGLYVRVEHGVIWLRAPRENGDHEVALETKTLENFLMWLTELRRGLHGGA